MIVINLWGVDPELNQRLAARLEYELLTVGKTIGRIPAGLIADDAWEMEEDFFEEGLTDVVISMSPCALISGEPYYVDRAYGVLDVMVETDEKAYQYSQGLLQTELLKTGLDEAIDLVLQPTKVRYMTRVTMDEYYNALYSPRFIEYTNNKLSSLSAKEQIT